ncbi:jhy protein homolog [Leucoraja erinacea]|uniref:jhy protein homolog n=1 Tax=Leucoraja erinaceus TaxID=7782 RepID=UPI002457F5DA|nr:jhy protein homolog [Leucoraja erinacea]XP_055516772.1 jhy protein homolog [Leucoraja erinacea]XP_055516773.1 jhy protein homolog [Leucoraja erinacea]XP_055516775.1 jhy protein homolog [Leucoraja erinacea]XP_055516776.1 jhy protein homolog [Leucoraja erinacea]
MDENKDPTQRRGIQFNSGDCNQLKEVSKRPFSQEQGEHFHLNLYDSLESDSDSLIQEKQYQLELKHRIQNNEEMVFQTLDTDMQNGDGEGQDFYDSLEETEDENEFDGNKFEAEHKHSKKTRNHLRDRYASLRYNPNWRNTREGEEILLSKEVIQQQSPHLNDSLMTLLQESNDLLENNVARSHEFEQLDLSEHKRLSYKSQGSRFGFKGNVNNVEKQPKRKRPPSPCKFGGSSQEECDSLDSSASYDENNTTDLHDHRKSGSEYITKTALWNKYGKNKCRNRTSDNEMLKDHKYKRFDLLEQKKQIGRSQGVRFRLKENDNNEEKSTKRKRPPSPYCKNTESSQEECDSPDSLGSYETNKSDSQKDRKLAPDRITETESQENHGKNKSRHEDNVENLNDHYEKEYTRYREHESMHGDGNVHRVKNRKIPAVSYDRKLQMKETSQNDIVERNKQTLGARKLTSYQQLYNEKKTKSTQEVSTAKSSNTMTIEESKQNTVEDQENNSIEMKWKQRAQKLQNCKTKQLSTKKKGLTKIVREKPPRPPNKPLPIQQVQKTHHDEKRRHIEDVEVHQNKNTSELLIIDRDDNCVPLTPGSDNTFSSVSLSHVGPAVIPNCQPTVNLNIHLNTSSDFVPSISGDNAQTTVTLVPSRHPMNHGSSYYKTHNIYNALQPQNPVPYLQDYQRIIRNPNQHNNDPSKFSTAFNAQEKAQYQLMCNAQDPFQALYTQAHHDLMVNPNYHQAAYPRALAAVPYNHTRSNPIPYSVNQEKVIREDNHLGKEHGNSGFTTLPFLTSQQQYLVQSPSTRLIQQMENIYKDTPRLAHTHPNSCLVLPSIYPMAGSDSELDTGRNNKIPTTMTRCNSDGYLAQMEKVNKLKENKDFKPFTVHDNKDLKQDVKLGGLGPDYTSSQDKAKKMKRQKEYAKQVNEQNLKGGCKSSTSLPNQSPSIENKNITSSRKVAIEYAKTIQKPKPVPANSKMASELEDQNQLTKLDHCVQLCPPENTMLEMLQERHEKEKQIVAAFKAMHVT